MLESITIPSSVTSLGDECFARCISLRSITIPSSVTSLGISCFGGFILESIYFDGKLPANIESSNIDINCKIYVHKEYLQDYKDALGTKYKYIYAIEDATNINQTKIPKIVATYEGDILTISGLANGEVVRFFSPDGKLLGTSKAENGIASCTVKSSIVIAKIGVERIKLFVK